MRTCCGFGLFGVDYLGGEASSLDDVRAGRGVLKKGAKGASVTAIQKLVGLTGADADGDFGSKTDAAVRRFQGTHGLTADGVVGKGTLAELDKSAGGSAAPSTIDFSDAEADSITVPAKKTVSSGAAATSSSALAPSTVSATDTTNRRLAVGAALAAAALAAGGLVYARWG